MEKLKEQSPERIGPVVIRNNGLTSFAPPCYCWELLDRNGGAVAIVSEVEISLPTGGRRTEFHDAVLAGRVAVAGTLERYEVAAAAPEPVFGLRLRVDRLVDFESGPQG